MHNTTTTANVNTTNANTNNINSRAHDRTGGLPFVTMHTGQAQLAPEEGDRLLVLLQIHVAVSERARHQPDAAVILQFILEDVVAFVQCVQRLLRLSGFRENRAWRARARVRTTAKKKHHRVNHSSGRAKDTQRACAHQRYVPYA
jgi:hypothetical protein